MKECDEFLDVLDKAGNPTGEILSREEVHQRGLWHRTVHLWVLNSQGQVLLQLRAPTVHSDPNRWDISSAGHIPAGEGSLVGAVRELKEELGIDAREEEFEFLFSTTHQIEVGRIFDRAYNDIYLIKRDIAPDDFKLQAEEVSQVRWIHWTALENLAADPQVVDHSPEYRRLYNILEQRLKR